MDLYSYVFVRYFAIAKLAVSLNNIKARKRSQKNKPEKQASEGLDNPTLMAFLKLFLVFFLSFS